MMEAAKLCEILITVYQEAHCHIWGGLNYDDHSSADHKSRTILVPKQGGSKSNSADWYW